MGRGGGVRKERGGGGGGLEKRTISRLDLRQGLSVFDVFVCNTLGRTDGHTEVGIYKRKQESKKKRKKERKKGNTLSTKKTIEKEKVCRFKNINQFYLQPLIIRIRQIEYIL